MKTIFFAFIICGIMACNGQQQENEAETTQEAVEQPATEAIEEAASKVEAAVDTLKAVIDSTVAPQ